MKNEDKKLLTNFLNLIKTRFPLISLGDLDTETIIGYYFKTQELRKTEDELTNALNNLIKKL